MHEHPLAPLLAPRSIALVGASRRANTPGHDMVRMLERGGFRGSVHAINPGYKEIAPFPCVPSLADLPAAPDLAVLSVRNERLEETSPTDAIGAQSAVIFASGFADDSTPPLTNRLATSGGTHRRYADLRQQLHGLLQRSRRRLGAASQAHESRDRFDRVHRPFGQRVGAFAPAIRVCASHWPSRRGQTRPNHDYIGYALERPEVKSSGLFRDRATRPFGAALATPRRSAAFPSSRSADERGRRRAALAHTGAMAGSDLRAEALFDRYGVVRVETLDELACTLLYSRPAAAQRRIARPVHDSGGDAMFIDLAQRAGVEFAPIAAATKEAIAVRLDPGLEPNNPLDAWGTGADFASVFEDCFRALLADENAALGVFAADIRDGYYLSEGFAAAALAAAATTTKPVVVVTNYAQLRHEAIALRLTEAGVPVLDGTYNGRIAVRARLVSRLPGAAVDPPPASRSPCTNAAAAPKSPAPARSMARSRCSPRMTFPSSRMVCRWRRRRHRHGGALRPGGLGDAGHHHKPNARRPSQPRRRKGGARGVARSRPASRTACHRCANDAKRCGNRARHGPRSAIRPARDRQCRWCADRIAVRSARGAGSVRARYRATPHRRAFAAPDAGQLSRRIRVTSTVSHSQSAVFRCLRSTSPISF
jgi:predicted CoA-binding protein